MKKIHLLTILAIIFTLSALTLAGCTGPEPNRIVDMTIVSSVGEEVQIGEFDIANYRIRLIMADGTDRFVNIKEEMINTDLSIFEELGLNNLSITYKGRTATLNISIVEPIFTVTYQVNGGSALAPRTSYRILNRPVTAKTDYIFAGWYDNEEFTGSQILFPFNVVENVTFYAKWVPDTVNVYNVYFDLDYPGAPAYTAQLIVENNTAETFAFTEREGYVFNGWYLNHSLWDIANDPVTYSITLVASWIEAD